tara:strand:- start:397 stop:555 length:159 start_codon:yes stop_codon:yes gene_type:complete
MENKKKISIHNYSTGKQYFITVVPLENEELEETIDRYGESLSNIEWMEIKED